MHTHPLADVHPTNFSKTLFPGQDYNNARIKDFENVWQFASGTIDLLDTARMPWHDVSVRFFFNFVWLGYGSVECDDALGPYDAHGRRRPRYRTALRRAVERDQET